MTFSWCRKVFSLKLHHHETLLWFFLSDFPSVSSVHTAWIHGRGLRLSLLFFKQMVSIRESIQVESKLLKSSTERTEMFLTTVCGTASDVPGRLAGFLHVLRLYELFWVHIWTSLTAAGFIRLNWLSIFHVSRSLFGDVPVIAVCPWTVLNRSACLHVGCCSGAGCARLCGLGLWGERCFTNHQKTG